MMLKLGSTVKHKLTGLTGTVIARAEYLYNVPHLLIQPAVKPDGTILQSVWFWEPEMDLVSGPPLSVVETA